jgi:hypothetical protein
MKLVRNLGAILLVLSSAVATANTREPGHSAFGDVLLSPFTPLCQLSYRSDSYGRGLEAGFKDQELDLRPDWSDDTCYRLGLQRGRELYAGKGTVGAFECRRQFQEGMSFGFAFNPNSAGTECFSAGYSAGSANLRIGARLGDKGTVGSACVDEYQRGRRDSLAQKVASPYGEARTSFCYQSGYFDAPIAP